MLQNSEVALADVRAQLEADLEAEVAAHAASQEQVRFRPDQDDAQSKREISRYARNAVLSTPYWIDPCEELTNDFCSCPNSTVSSPFPYDIHTLSPAIPVNDSHTLPCHLWAQLELFRA